MKVGKEQEVAKMLQEAKMFIAIFDDIVSNLSNEDVNSCRNKLRKFK